MRTVDAEISWVKAGDLFDVRIKKIVTRCLIALKYIEVMSKNLF